MRMNNNALLVKEKKLEWMATVCWICPFVLSIFSQDSSHSMGYRAATCRTCVSGKAPFDSLQD